jgi:hypothetical protein
VAYPRWRLRPSKVALPGLRCEAMHSTG